MMMMAIYLTQSPHPTVNLSKSPAVTTSIHSLAQYIPYSILNTDHSEVMGGKIESDANMSNQRINLNKLSGDLLSHYLHSDPTYNSENSVEYIFIFNSFF